MVQIDFYNLQTLKLESVLPFLLQRTLEQKKKAAIWFQRDETLNVISQQLWKAPYPHWLPHGGHATKCPSLQPIWLTTKNDLPNHATYLFLTENCVCDRPQDFTRIFYLFNDLNDMDKARQHWKLAQTLPGQLTYWKKENNKWVYRKGDNTAS